jgi:alkanesulfonate monooxygenase SsuD/methylene tetrahydromethanopterin reductase-like flavin-dependent oxidoreductase (luciferase family)
MKIGIGLPSTIPGTPGRLLVDWARRAEERGFTSLATIDRIAYPSYESLTALSAAAAATERIELLTNILLAPNRNPVILAKEAATVDQVSGGRLTLGLAVGARAEDYEAAGAELRGRGRRLSEQLAYLRAGVDAERVGPARDGIELLVGGLSGQAFARMARYADGYAHGGGPPRAFERAAASARAAWSDLGRPGRPLLWGQGYFALGDEDAGAAYLRDYYAFTGPFAERIAAGNLTSARAIKDFVRGYAEAGCDELVLLPSVADAGQLDRLAEVLA